MRILLLIVGALDIHQGDMLVAETGVGILLSISQERLTGCRIEPNSFLRTVLNTSKTELAIALCENAT